RHQPPEGHLFGGWLEVVTLSRNRLGYRQRELLRHPPVLCEDGLEVVLWRRGRLRDQNGNEKHRVSHASSIRSVGLGRDPSWRPSALGRPVLPYFRDSNRLAGRHLSFCNDQLGP